MIDKIDYLDKKIYSKIMAKIVYLRLNIKSEFKDRHLGSWPELKKYRIMKDVDDLRMFIRMSDIFGKRTGYYPEYEAKTLSNK